jgi:hypothetical protein
MEATREHRMLIYMGIRGNKVILSTVLGDNVTPFEKEYGVDTEPSALAYYFRRDFLKADDYLMRKYAKEQQEVYEDFDAIRWRKEYRACRKEWLYNDNDFDAFAQMIYSYNGVLTQMIENAIARREQAWRGVVPYEEDWSEFALDQIDIGA